MTHINQLKEGFKSLVRITTTISLKWFYDAQQQKNIFSFWIFENWNWNEMKMSWSSSSSDGRIVFVCCTANRLVAIEPERNVVNILRSVFVQNLQKIIGFNQLLKRKPCLKHQVLSTLTKFEKFTPILTTY